jgi:hypothetical protein
MMMMTTTTTAARRGMRLRHGTLAGLLLLILLLLPTTRGSLGFQQRRSGGGWAPSAHRCCRAGRNPKVRRGGPAGLHDGTAAGPLLAGHPRQPSSRAYEARTTLVVPSSSSSSSSAWTSCSRLCCRGGTLRTGTGTGTGSTARRLSQEASFRAAAAATTTILTLALTNAAPAVAATAAAEAAVSIPTDSASAAAYVAGAWSVFLMLVLVGLLTVWEQGVKNLQQTLPKPLRPVLNSVLGEMGGLGFIGLLLSTFVTHSVGGEWLERAGEATLHDSEILVETFEFLHTAFFQVGMTFFGVSALLVLRSLRQLAVLDEVTQVAMSNDNFNCLAALAESSTSSSSSSTDAGALVRPPPPSASSGVSTEDLLVRERLVQQFDLNPAQFRVENYFGSIMGTTLEEFVELAPCTAWLPLIPALSQGRSIDMSRDVVSASSTNALASAGYFVSTPSFVAGTSIAALGGMVWGGWNYWKMNEIKRMVLPSVQGGRQAEEEAVRMVDPPYLNATDLAAFDSSPTFFGWIEAAVKSTFFDDEKEDKCEDLDSRQGRQLRLFGTAGTAGPELYLRSIKFHTWLVTTQVVFWGTQIVARDVSAVASLYATGAAGVSAEIGRPEFVVAELLLYGTFVGAALFQLLYVAPQTFWNYILVTSVEEFAKPDLLRASCCDIGILDAEGKADS